MLWTIHPILWNIQYILVCLTTPTTVIPWRPVFNLSATSLRLACWPLPSTCGTLPLLNGRNKVTLNTPWGAKLHKHMVSTFKHTNFNVSIPIPHDYETLHFLGWMRLVVYPDLESREKKQDSETSELNSTMQAYCRGSISTHYLFICTVLYALAVKVNKRTNLGWGCEHARCKHARNCSWETSWNWIFCQRT